MAEGLSDLKPVHLIYGSEELLLERAVRRLRDRLAKVADLDFNLEVFDGATAGADAVINAANTMPFMSERRLVIVWHTDKMSTPDQAALADYAADPSPDTCLVLVAEKVNRGTRLYKAVNALGGAAEYAAPKRGEYPSHVAEMFRAAGKRADAGATRAMVEVVGEDLRRLDSEVEKVVAYVGASDTVTQADITAVVSAGAAVSVFTLLDRVGARDAGGSLRLLARMLDAGESVHGVHAMMVRHVRGLLGAGALDARGVSPDAMAPLLGMAPWQARKAAEQARHFKPVELSRALRRAASAEAVMKSGGQDARIVLERWIAETCRSAS